MDWIIPLEQAASDVGAAGGKGANLGALIEAGLPVPQGWVITTAAYQQFNQQNGVFATIEAIGAQIDLEDPASAQKAASRIADQLNNIQLPDNLSAAIREAYEGLGGMPVAVRSSVVSEDPNSTFCGQGDTFLNVLGDEALLKAVKSCWISLWSEQAVIARARRSIAAREVTMAVVVQKMFRADISGVIMTVNVDTFNPDEMVIRAARGFGEAVLHGQVIPQEVIFNRYSRTISRQSNLGQLAILPDQALELVRIGERIEQHFGCHQTIEWAWDEDTFCVLQSHPITVAIPPRVRWESPHAGITYTRQGLMELLPHPVSTLFETCGLPALEGGILAYQTHLEETETTVSGSFETIHGFVYQRENAHGGLNHLLALPRMRRATEHAIDHWEQEALPKYQLEVQILTADPGDLSARELADRIVSLAEAGGRYWAVVLEMMAPLEQAEQRFRTLYARLAKDGDPHYSTFLRGLETRYLQAERDFDRFNESFGHVIYELDFSHPLTGEDMSAWEVTRSAGINVGAITQERFLRYYGERIAAEEQMRARLSGWQRRMFGPVLNDAQQAVKAREDALFELGLAWVPLRKYAFELGQRLTAAGALQEAGQIFWLHRSELFVLAAALEEGKDRVVSQVAKVQNRAAVSSAAYDLQSPMRIPEKAENKLPEKGSLIFGRGVGPGQVTGTARLLTQSKDIQKLQPGDIIVAAAIPPAWTPLFLVAAGAVTDLGGDHSPSSRAACLDGLPMVMEAGYATRVIQDGDMITVDGDSGIVTIGENASLQS
jgi:rifampicin phosphotransferase